ncbi:MAG: hypothetical protein LAT63_10665 [Marinobacter sp.]|nr:hypothetical protein [Marinobacter sp.]
MLLGFLILRLTLARRLKKKLRATGEYWETGTLGFGFMNTILFAWACTIPWVQRQKNFQLIYRDLDVRAFANWFERGVAYSSIYGLIVLLVSIPVFLVVEALM